MQTLRFAFLMFVAAAFLPGSVSAQTSQAKAMTFALGVNSGFASTQVYEPITWNGNSSPGSPSNPNGCGYGPREDLLKKAFSDADKLISGLRGEGIQIDNLPANWKDPCWGDQPVPDEAEAWRAATQVKISKQSAVAGQVYGLGVNIGIAEAQASLGDSRRQIVYMALLNALPFAKALELDVTALNQCILLASGTTPMAEIHQKILLVRTTYQAMM